MTDWYEVMEPLTNSQLWPVFRKLAERSILADMGEDSGFGISTSDINHTVFTYAEVVYKRSPQNYRGSEVLRYMVQVV